MNNRSTTALNTLKAIIVEDVERARLDLADMIEQYCPQVKVVNWAENSATALQLLRAEQPDLVFMDLTLHGIQIMDLLKDKDLAHTSVIVVSGNENVDRKLVRPETVAYLNKPVDPVELIAAVDRVEYNIREKEPRGAHRLQVANKDGLHLLKLADVLKLVASNNRTVIHSNQLPEPICVSRTLKSFQFLEDEHNFCRVHHSHLVNLDHVAKYTLLDGGLVTLSDGSHLSISRPNLAKFLDKLEGHVLRS